MKKSLCIAVFLFFSTVGTTYASTVQEQYISALQQVILLLQEQVSGLLQQLQELTVIPTPETLVPQIQQIIQTVQATPAPLVPLEPFIVGSITLPIPPSLTVLVNNEGFCGDYSNYFNGVDPIDYRITVFENIPNTPVTFSSDDTGYFVNNTPYTQGLSTTTVTVDSAKYYPYNGNGNDLRVVSEANYCSVKTTGVTFTATDGNAIGTASI